MSRKGIEIDRIAKGIGGESRWLPGGQTAEKAVPVDTPTVDWNRVERLWLQLGQRKVIVSTVN